MEDGGGSRRRSWEMNDAYRERAEQLEPDPPAPKERKPWVSKRVRRWWSDSWPATVGGVSALGGIALVVWLAVSVDNSNARTRAVREACGTNEAVSAEAMDFGQYRVTCREGSGDAVHIVTPTDCKCVVEK